jgi:hypothetical protein
MWRKHLMQISFFISAKILRLLRAFSLTRNLRTLLDTENTQNDVHCLNGIRTLNALSLIIFHKSVALYFNPYVNRTYMTEVKERCNWILSYCSVTFSKKCLFYLAIINAKQSHFLPGEAVRVLGGWGSQILRQSLHEGGKVFSPTHRPPLPPSNISGTHFCQRLSRPHGGIVVGRIMSMKNSNDTIGNWIRDLPAFSAVIQQTSPPRVTIWQLYIRIYISVRNFWKGVSPVEGITLKGTVLKMLWNEQ